MCTLFSKMPACFPDGSNGVAVDETKDKATSEQRDKRKPKFTVMEKVCLTGESITPSIACINER